MAFVFRRGDVGMRSKQAIRCGSVAALLAMSGHAQAAYTVISDDLYPSALQAAEASLPAEHFKIDFARGAAQLGPKGRASVDALLPKIRGATHVRIVGGTDFGTSAAQLTLALNRAAAIRSYLERLGVSIENVVVDGDNSPPPMSAEIFVGSRPNARQSAVAALQGLGQVDNGPSIPHMPPPRAPRTPAQHTEFLRSGPIDSMQSRVDQSSAPSARSAEDERLLRYISDAVTSGLMLPSVAAQILRTLSAASHPAQAAEAQVPRQATAALERWVLDARLNLKQNLDSWAQAAGWNPTIWEASNYYQVTATTTVEGAFPEVLRRIADSTGLNICALLTKRVVRVTDAGRACAPN